MSTAQPDPAGDAAESIGRELFPRKPTLAYEVRLAAIIAAAYAPQTEALAEARALVQSLARDVNSLSDSLGRKIAELEEERALAEQLRMRIADLERQLAVQQDV